jgi:transposase-like protein
VPHCTTRYANNLLEPSHRAVKQRIRPMLEFKRFASVARFCQAQDVVQNFLRSRPSGHQPGSLAWQRRICHYQFTLLREMRLAA